MNNLNPWAKSLTKLEVIEITIFCYSNISDSFLVQLFQSSSNTLTRLVIRNEGQTSRFPLGIIRVFQQIGFIQTFQQIPIYLQSLSHLELPEVLPSELISIFKSCIKLVYFKAILNNDEDLINLGKLVPKSLERIRFKQRRLVSENH
jgi:hypothetical protein